MDRLGSHGTDFHEILFLRVFFENPLRKFKFHSNRTRIAVTLHGDQYTFLIISHSVRLIIRKILDKGYRENQNTCFIFKKFFFFSKIAPL